MSESICSCGWPHPEDKVAGFGHCCMCHEPLATSDLLEHVRVIHPDQYGDGPERWSDGNIVVHDETLTPEDFG